MMETSNYVNRYGNEFTFELTDEGIVWKGNFEHHRIGWPNDYSKAYEAYLQSGGNLSIEKFRIEIHKNNNSEMREKFGKLVTSDTNTINMVDPSGGPYMFAGQKFMKKTIRQFKPIEGGYLIVVD